MISPALYLTLALKPRKKYLNQLIFFVLVALLVLSMGLLSLQSPMETLDDVLVNPVEPALVSLLEYLFVISCNSASKFEVSWNHIVFGCFARGHP